MYFQKISSKTNPLNKRQLLVSSSREECPEVYRQKREISLQHELKISYFTL